MQRGLSFRLPRLNNITPSDDDYYRALNNGDLSRSNPYCRNGGRIKNEGGNVWSYRGKQKREVPHPSDRPRLIKEVHNLGHFGISKTIKMVQERFWWPKMYGEVRTCVSQCNECQRRKSISIEKGTTPFVASYPMDVLAWDIMGPIDPSRRGNKYIVVVVDVFSRWMEIGALADTKAETLANFIWKQVISRFGPPHRIHSDKGANLNAQVVKNLYDT